MTNIYKIKQIGIILLIIIIIGAIVFSIRTNTKNSTDVAKEDIVKNEEVKPISLCYYRADKTSSEFYDRAWLKLSLSGDKITGEFQHLPAESDSKIGTFEGIAGPLDQEIMGRRANVWWNSRAEGMEVKEELAIEWGDGSATVGFGEMVDRGDGVYVYKDKSNLYYIKSMSQIDCESLSEKLLIEQYIKDNISTIAVNKPVLGGNWYTLTVKVNTGSKNGEVTYEDGHIQSKATFKYTFDSNLKKIVISEFTIVK